MSFAITRGTGFQMRFANGWAISVQFGTHNYSDARNIPAALYTKPAPNFNLLDAYPPSSQLIETAEVAVFQPDGEFFPLQECDDVLGWVNAEDVARLIGETAARPAWTDQEVADGRWKKAKLDQARCDRLLAEAAENRTE